VIAPSSNGKIPDSDSVYRGSNPRGASKPFLRAGGCNLKLLSFVKSAALASFSVLSLYGVAAAVGSAVAVNRDWSESPHGTQVYVVSNGYHTGLVVPTAADGIDLSLVFRPTDLPNSEDAGNFLIVGWGDRDFYLNTPNWRDVKPRLLVTALLGSGKTLLHVDHLRSLAEVAGARPITLTPHEYAGLTQHIIASVRLDDAGHPLAMPGYGSLDVFYEARGTYNLFRTCNVWTAQTLAAAGVKVGWWTPFSGGVMWWF
jgi:uncharacterized protein (TIGR02117 family)